MPTCSSACPHLPHSTMLHSAWGLGWCLQVEAQSLWWGLTYQLWKGQPRPVPILTACKDFRGAGQQNPPGALSFLLSIWSPSALVISTHGFLYPVAPLLFTSSWLKMAQKLVQGSFPGARSNITNSSNSAFPWTLQCAQLQHLHLSMGASTGYTSLLPTFWTTPMQEQWCASSEP